MIRKILLSSIIIVGVSEEVKAQDPQFTQFYANPIYLNPAFAGSAKCPRFVFNYRNQWTGMSGTFVTYTASYDQHVNALDGGIGVQMLYDQAGEGTLNTTRVTGQYAYQVNLSREFAVRAGAEVTYHQRTLDWSKLTFGDQIHPQKGFIFSTMDVQKGGKSSVMDFSAGIMGFTDKIYFGFAAHHLTEPNESVILGESSLPRKYTAHAGAKFKIRDAKYSRNSSSSVSPNILYHQQANFQQLLFGLYITKGALTGGVWYRNKDAFIVLAGVQTDRLRFGYSYDVTVSRLTMKTAGSHELSLAIQLDCPPKKRIFRTISCPSF